MRKTLICLALFLLFLASGAMAEELSGLCFRHTGVAGNIRGGVPVLSGPASGAEESFRMEPGDRIVLPDRKGRRGGICWKAAPVPAAGSLSRNAAGSAVCYGIPRRARPLAAGYAPGSAGYPDSGCSDGYPVFLCLGRTPVYRRIRPDDFS